MSAAISRAELAAVFGAEQVVTVPAAVLHPAVTDAASRRHLTELGLPVRPGFVYEPEGALAAGLRPAPEAEPEFASLRGLPETAGSWVSLGYCYDQLLFLDGATGLVWALPDGELTVTLAHRGVDAFAAALAALAGVWDEFDEGTTLDRRRAAAERLTGELGRIDAAAVADRERLWPRLLDGLVLDYPG